MTQANTKYLDLDAVLPAREVVVKFNGKKHTLAPVTLSDFVKNTQALNSVGEQSTPIEEMQLISDMLLRAFPTMGQADIDGLTLDQLHKLYEFATEVNGSAQVAQEAAAEAKPDPTQAGQ